MDFLDFEPIKLKPFPKEGFYVHKDDPDFAIYTYPMPDYWETYIIKSDDFTGMYEPDEFIWCNNQMEMLKKYPFIDGWLCKPQLAKQLELDF